MKKTLVLKVNAAAPDPAMIEQAAAILRQGGLVAFPTETVYGLGGNALDLASVQAIFEAKERPSHDPLIVHLATLDDLQTVVSNAPAQAYTLGRYFWPGPLTMVLPRAERIPLAVAAGGATVAVRVPAHPVALALIRAAGVPIAAPSANRFGRLSPTRAEHVLADLDGRVDLILDGGPTTVGVESTVLSLITSVPTVLRPGGVSVERLTEVLGDVAVRLHTSDAQEIAHSPGMTLQHYAPQARLILYQGASGALLRTLRAAVMHFNTQGIHVGVLVAEEDLGALKDLPATLKSAGSLAHLDTVAQQLFETLRAFDQAGVGIILARDFGPQGLGLAIRDRLTRAAAGHVVKIEPA